MTTRVANNIFLQDNLLAEQCSQYDEIDSRGNAAGVCIYMCVWILYERGELVTGQVCSTSNDGDM